MCHFNVPFNVSCFLEFCHKYEETPQAIDCRECSCHPDKYCSQALSPFGFVLIKSLSKSLLSLCGPTVFPDLSSAFDNIAVQQEGAKLFDLVQKSMVVSVGVTNKLQLTMLPLDMSSILDLSSIKL